MSLRNSSLKFHGPFSDRLGLGCIIQHLGFANFWKRFLNNCKIKKHFTEKFHQT